MERFPRLIEFDFRTFDTIAAIASLRNYFESMEDQMEALYQSEREALKAEFKLLNVDDNDGEYRTHASHLEARFEDGLIVTMRYSFIVLMHILFETRLQSFCDSIKLEKQIPISSKDLWGSPIERTKTFLTKLAGLPVANAPGWPELKDLQKIRDCIVHTSGVLDESRDRERVCRLISLGKGIRLDDENQRLVFTRDFCSEQIAVLDAFFRHIFLLVGWKV